MTLKVEMKITHDHLKDSIGMDVRMQSEGPDGACQHELGYWKYIQKLMKTYPPTVEEVASLGEVETAIAKAKGTAVVKGVRGDNNG